MGPFAPEVTKIKHEFVTFFTEISNFSLKAVIAPKINLANVCNSIFDFTTYNYIMYSIIVQLLVELVAGRSQHFLIHWRWSLERTNGTKTKDGRGSKAQTNAATNHLALFVNCEYCTVAISGYGYTIFDICGPTLTDLLVRQSRVKA